MIKKYIKGHELRGAEVIKALEELGGENKLNLNGKDCNCLYYIREDSVIDVLSKSFFAGKLVQECFEEIKLPEQFNIVVKEPKQIYWFKATEDEAKNQALLDKLNDLVGKDKKNAKMANGIVIYNPGRDSFEFHAGDCSAPTIAQYIAMMVGQELVIDEDEQV